MRKPDYAVVIEALADEDGGGFVATVLDLPGCMSDGGAPGGGAGNSRAKGGVSHSLKVFFFGLGYCAHRLVQRETWIEASGTARSSETVAALRREGIEACQFDGTDADPGLEQAL